MRKLLGSFSLLMAAAACAPNPAPVIVDLETDKVVVESGTEISNHEIKLKAREGCAIHGRYPVTISYRIVRRLVGSTPADLKHSLFACTKP